MPQLVKSNISKIVTKDGECEISISLDININLTSNGIQIATENPQVQALPEPTKEAHIIPDFKSIPKIKFGKDVGKE